MGPVRNDINDQFLKPWWEQIPTKLYFSILQPVDNLLSWALTSASSCHGFQVTSPCPSVGSPFWAAGKDLKTRPKQEGFIPKSSSDFDLFVLTSCENKTLDGATSPWMSNSETKLHQQIRIYVWVWKFWADFALEIDKPLKNLRFVWSSRPSLLLRGNDKKTSIMFQVPISFLATLILLSVQWLLQLAATWNSHAILGILGLFNSLCRKKKKPGRSPKFWGWTAIVIFGGFLCPATTSVLLSREDALRWEKSKRPCVNPWLYEQNFLWWQMSVGQIQGVKIHNVLKKKI